MRVGLRVETPNTIQTAGWVSQVQPNLRYSESILILSLHRKQGLYLSLKKAFDGIQPRFMFGIVGAASTFKRLGKFFQYFFLAFG